MASLISAIKRKLASIFPFPITNNELSNEVENGSASEKIDNDRPRKRQRLHEPTAGTATPHLLSESTPFIPPSPTRLDFVSNEFLSPYSHNGRGRILKYQPSTLLRLLPNDVLSHCFSFISTSSDRYGLQGTCATFRRLSNEDEMLASIDLGGASAVVANLYSSFDVLENAVQQHGGPVAAAGDNAVEAAAVGENENDDDENENPAMIALQSSPPSAGGIILDSDTSITACTKLVKFAAAGNIQASYMIAMILCYCHENISEGLALLRHAASSTTSSGHHHLPSIYALALILRDSRHAESDHYLNMAASLGFLPAWQEKLTAAEMRAQFGDLDATKLVQYLDPPCLNRLMGRHYLECQRVKKKHQTSHCWNPLCGRWAYKALRVENNPRRARLARLRAYLNEQAGVGGAGDDHHHHVGAPDNDGDMQQLLELANANNNEGNRNNLSGEVQQQQHSCSNQPIFSIESLLPPPVSPVPDEAMASNPTALPSTEHIISPLEQIREVLRNKKVQLNEGHGLKVSRMKMCSSCRRAKYCSKLCQVYDWRSGRHKMECQFL